jgi:hypothetical protein
MADENYLIKFKMVADNAPKVLAPRVSGAVRGVAGAAAGGFAQNLLAAALGAKIGKRGRAIARAKTKMPNLTPAQRKTLIEKAKAANKHFMAIRVSGLPGNKRMHMFSWEGKKIDDVIHEKVKESVKTNSQMLEAVYSNRETALKTRLAEEAAIFNNRINALQKETGRIGKLYENVIDRELKGEMRRGTSTFTKRMESQIATEVAIPSNIGTMPSPASTSEIMRRAGYGQQSSEYSSKIMAAQTEALMKKAQPTTPLQSAATFTGLRTPGTREQEMLDMPKVSYELQPIDLERMIIQKERTR